MGQRGSDKDMVVFEREVVEMENNTIAKVKDEK